MRTGESEKFAQLPRNQPSQHHQLLAFEFAIYPFFNCYRLLVNKKNFIQVFVTTNLFTELAGNLMSDMQLITVNKYSI